MIKLPLSCEWPHLGFGGKGVANSDPLRPLRQSLHELVVDGIMQEESGAGHAALAPGGEDAGDDSIYGALTIGVREYNDRRLATQLQGYLRQIFGRVPDHLPGRSRSAGE